MFGSDDDGVHNYYTINYPNTSHKTKNENIQDNKCMYKNAGRLLTRCYTSSNTCETNDIKRVVLGYG